MVPCSKSLMGFFLLFLFFASAHATSSVLVSDGTTVYEILSRQGLSISEEGSFVVKLEKPCYVQFDYLVYYDQKITSTINYGSITNLDGIKVRRFLWLDVDEIRVDLPPNDYIYFQVGLINKKLDAEQFKTVHSCKDGLSHQGSWKDILKEKNKGGEAGAKLP